MADERFDGMLLQFAQQHNGITDVLSSFFSFMRRKTDFFTGQTAPGQAEQVILKVCREQAALAERTNAERKKRLAVAQAEKEKKNAEKAARRAAAMAKDYPSADGDDEDDDDAPTLGGKSGEVSAANSAPALPKPAAASASVAASSKSSTPVQKFTEADGGAEVLDNSGGAAAAEGEEEEEESKGKKPNAGNGAKTATHEWTQTLKDLVIMVPVPLGTRGKDLIVSVAKDYIKVGRKGEPLLLDGKLHKPCRAEELIWTIDDNDADTGRVITLELPKKNQMEWWKCIVQGEEEIDTSKVEPENSKLGDLDRDTRQTVEKMMFDQRQKALNKPTSDEMKKEDIMKKFMAQHPEMDFSNVKMQ